MTCRDRFKKKKRPREKSNKKNYSIYKTKEINLAFDSV